MTTRFTQVVEAIKTQLDADWPTNTVTFAEGLAERSVNSAPNRVVWVRRGGRTVEVDGIGPGTHDSDVTPGTDVSSAAILTDQYDVEADVWGSDEETADAIRVAVIRAGHGAASNRSVESSRWVDLSQQDGEGQYMTHGAKHRIDFVFRVPILDAQETALALITTDATTVDFITETTFATTIANQLDLDGPP